MNGFTSEIFLGVFTIVLLDLVLAGDNALVIGMAARHLPPEQQKKAIWWGTVGAIVIRVLATILVVQLLKIPGLLLGGGLILLWIAYRFLVEEKKHEVTAKNSLWSAIRTIIIADAVMGFDNVLAVAGASHGRFSLVVLGLLLSMPLVVWGSTVVVRWMNRFPAIAYIGSAVLAWTAARMIVEEPFLHQLLVPYPLLKWGSVALMIVIVLFLGWWMKRKQADGGMEKTAQVTPPPQG